MTHIAAAHRDVNITLVSQMKERYNSLKYTGIKRKASLMGQVMRNFVLCHVRTTKAQISLRIRAVWSARFAA